MEIHLAPAVDMYWFVTMIKVYLQLSTVLKCLTHCLIADAYTYKTLWGHFS